MSTAEEAPSEREFGESRPDNVQASPDEAPQIEPRHDANEAADAWDRRTDRAARDGNGPAEQHVQGQGNANVAGDGDPLGASGPVGGTSQNGDLRRTLHLSLSQDGANRSETQHQDASGLNASGSGERFAARPVGGQQQRLVQPGRQGSAHSPPATNGEPVRMMTEPHKTREGSAFIDQALRERVDGDITAFLAAFDAALAQDTPESRTGLREATDRLLRAGARTRIELERLEARLPLPPRDNSGQTAPAWRPR